MTRKILTLVFTFTLGAIVGYFAGHGSVLAQTRKAVTMTRVYNGSDNLGHSEEVELKFTGPNGGNVSKLLPVTGAEIRRNSAGTVADWHNAPRRQYVITLTGRGEVEVAGGKKIALEPGHIDLVEDTTGKGDITRNIGAEDRITLWLPLADQTGR